MGTQTNRKKSHRAEGAGRRFKEEKKSGGDRHVLGSRETKVWSGCDRGVLARGGSVCVVIRIELLLVCCLRGGGEGKQSRGGGAAVSTQRPGLQKEKEQGAREAHGRTRRRRVAGLPPNTSPRLFGRGAYAGDTAPDVKRKRGGHSNDLASNERKMGGSKEF